MTRLSVNVNDETAKAIRTTMANRQTTATDVIRRAVSVYEFLHNAQRDGQQIETVDKKGRTTRVVIL